MYGRSVRPLPHIGIIIIITVLRYAIRGQTKNVSRPGAVRVARGRVRIPQTPRPHKQSVVWPKLTIFIKSPTKCNIFGR